MVKYYAENLLTDLSSFLNKLNSIVFVQTFTAFALSFYCIKEHIAAHILWH